MRINSAPPASTRRFTLRLLRGRLAVCRAPAETPVPDWLWSQPGPLTSATRTASELSIVCDEAATASAAVLRVEPGWRALRVVDALEFEAVGVLAALVEPLARVGVSLFSVSTFDTDYLLVKQADLGRALEALQRAGHVVEINDGPV